MRAIFWGLRRIAENPTDLLLPDEVATDDITPHGIALEHGLLTGERAIAPPTHGILVHLHALSETGRSQFALPSSHAANLKRGASDPTRR